MIIALGVAVTTGCVVLAATVVALHLNIQPVLTGSMRPTYGPGALVVTEPVPVADLHPGMIVLFTPPGKHAQFAHRIVTVTGPRTAPIITTKGDANRYPDPWHAQLTSATVPRVVATVPWIGRLMVGLRGSLQLVLIILGGLTVAVAGARWILQPRRTLVGPTS
jgi:signal peptidase